jgi:multidrug efflux pump subunit AcrA (membrane-fusion protein)
LAGLALLLIVALIAAQLLGGAAPPTATPTATAAVKLMARGRLQPVAKARVSTLGGGVVTRLAVVAGETVADRQELARIRLNETVEVLTAPWAGTITSLPVNQGDTVLAGTLIATIGDLSRLQVETTDVDEYLIGRLRLGQPASLTIDALDRLVVRGYVQQIGLVLQSSGTSDEHYPVVIALAEAAPGLRPGMTVRIRFDE